MFLFIGAVCSDTNMHDLCPEPNGKRGRPRKKGVKLNIKDFEYTKEDDYYIATKKVLTNLFDEPVLVTVITTDADKFSFVRVYVCSMKSSDIQSFKNYTVDGSGVDKERINLIGKE